MHRVLLFIKRAVMTLLCGTGIGTIGIVNIPHCMSTLRPAAKVGATCIQFHTQVLWHGTHTFPSAATTTITSKCRCPASLFDVRLHCIALANVSSRWTHWASVLEEEAFYIVLDSFLEWKRRRRRRRSCQMQTKSLTSLCWHRDRDLTKTNRCPYCAFGCH
jgi:hypothetical protein